MALERELNEATEKINKLKAEKEQLDASVQVQNLHFFLPLASYLFLYQCFCKEILLVVMILTLINIVSLPILLFYQTGAATAVDGAGEHGYRHFYPQAISDVHSRRVRALQR